MTFSIVAQVGDAFGVAVASKFIAVGSVVPAARLGVGAVATQAFAKVSYKDDVLDLLASGSDPATALATVTAADEGSATRQLGIVSATSQVTFTGAECNAWAGGLQGRDASGGYAIQGNILVGDRVVNQMEDAWLSSPHLPVSARLMHALLAGDRAGGDRRGRQSAALYVVAPGAGYDAGGVLADLRVDDHPDAPTELARLLDLNDLYLTASTDEEKVPVTPELEAELEQRARALGARDFAAWVGTENYEMRVAHDGTWIDRRILDLLRSEEPGA
jgi:uncharacterized Ntn-hydrolase superfamily protein